MEKRKILIVDDEETFVRMVKLNLESTGKYEVRTETKGGNALSAAKQFHPDLILLDIVMPDMEGSAVAEQIMGDDEAKNIPIVFLTALVTQKEIGTSCVFIGNHPYIAKPVSSSDLINCIEKNIRK
ncbi:MAG: response regulator [Candidatus Omnitrophota bacterium]